MSRPLTQEDKDALELREAVEPTWFRVEAEHSEYTSRLVVIDIPVIKHTLKGAWVMRRTRHGSAKYLVLRNYTHRGRAYAAPTIAQARDDFRKRKKFQIQRLQQELRNAESELDLLHDVGLHL